MTETSTIAITRSEPPQLLHRTIDVVYGSITIQSAGFDGHEVKLRSLQLRVRLAGATNPAGPRPGDTVPGEQAVEGGGVHRLRNVAVEPGTPPGVRVDPAHGQSR